MESRSPDQTPSSRQPESGPGGHRPRARVGKREGLVTRKRVERQAARARIAGRTRRPLTETQQSFDPLARPSHRRGRRTAVFWSAVLGSLLIHLSAIGVGIWLRGQAATPASRQEVKIEVRQRPPEPPPEKKPEPPPPIEKPARTPPKIVKAPPPSAPPPPPTKVPPVRVVGLSLESTTEGGEGPAFAVGNTRLGETAARAVAPKDVSAGQPGLDPNATEARGPGRSNQAASRIPVAGVTMELPKRRTPHKPPYPPLLKNQNVEDDVMVLVSLDATGKVIAVKLVKASQYPEFNDAARETALKEEFDPATKNGVPIPYQLSFTYRFRLEDQ